MKLMYRILQIVKWGSSDEAFGLRRFVLVVSRRNVGLCNQDKVGKEITNAIFILDHTT